MRMLIRRLGLLGLSLLLLTSAAAPAAADPAASAQASAALQLVADQNIVSVEDSARFHILYQNTTGRAVGEAKLSVALPVGLTLVSMDGVDWAPMTRTATWTVQNIEAGGARAVHFSARADSAARAGAQLPVTLAGVSDTSVSADVVTVPLNVGDEVHQPLFIGFPDGLFHPGSGLTRGEAAAVVARIKQLPAAGPGTAGYTDVPASHWANEYISRVTASGYMTGSGGRFKPDAPLSRAELVVLLLRLRAVEPVGFPAFADTGAHWAVKAISTAHALEWVDGASVDQFLPDGPADRQVAARLFTIALYRRSLVDGDAKVIQHFPDVPKDAWAFGWVEEVALTAHLARTDGQVAYLIRYLPDQTHPL